MTQSNDSNRLLTPEQAAAYLGTTKKTLESWRGNGNGPPFAKLSGKCVRYKLEDLDAHVERCMRTSTAPAA